MIWSLSSAQPFNSSDGVMSEVVASYRSECDVIAVKTRRTNFVLLAEKELDGCLKTFHRFLLNEEPGVSYQLGPFLSYGPVYQEQGEN